MKRKSIKKTLITITAMALAFTGTPEGLLSGVVITSATNTVASGTCGENLTWTLDQEGVLEISGSGEMYHSPAERAMPWNNRRNDIKTVQINEGVTAIGLSDFNGCTRLSNIKIPSSVTEIYYFPDDCYNDLKWIEVSEGNSTFCSVDGVLFDKNVETLICYGKSREATNYQIPESVTTIGSGAFNKCNNLTNITIPDNVTDIGTYAFDFCSNLTNITIPDGVTKIGHCAFRGCSGLKSISIPKSVIDIDTLAFEECSSLTDINVAEENSQYQSIDDVLYDKTLETLICYCSGKETAEFQVPEGVKDIEMFAFNNCKSLTKITIPASVTKIRCIESPFSDFAAHSFTDYTENWSNLKNIEVAEENSTYQSVDGILYDKKLETLICYGSGREASDFNIPNSVTTIKTNAFWGCKYLSRITIPDSVTAISNSAFRNCCALKNIETSQQNPKYCSIDGILYDKTATTLLCYGSGRELSHFIIPQGIATIGSFAFNYCKNLSTVVMPDSITYIGSGAFHECSNLKKIQLSKNISEIPIGAFAFCESLKSISLPSNTHISLYTLSFVSCRNLRNIRIPENVTFYTQAFDRFCPPDLTIYGVKGSTAETYARNNVINFKDISEYTEEPDETPTPSPGNEDTPPSNPGENDTTPSPDGSNSKPPTSSPDSSDSKPPTPSLNDSDSKPPTPTPSDGNDNKPSAPTPSPEGNDSKPSTPSPSPSPDNSGGTSTKPDPKPGNALPPISREEQEKNEWQLNKKIQSGWKGNALSVHWSKVPKASGYDLYAAACSTDYDQIAVSAKGQNKTAAKITQIAGKRISKKATYKVIVRAYRLVDGKKQYIGTSADMHIAGSKNKQYTNAKSIKLLKKKITLKQKKKVKIAARIVKQHRRKKLLSKTHGPRLRYTSSDNSLATVSKGGVLHAKKKGSCIICVRALNGISKQIKVTVK